MSKKNTGRYFLWLLIIFVVISNIPPVKWIYTWFAPDDYDYSTYNGSFTFDEIQFKGRDFRMCKDLFIKLKESHELPDSSRLYRLNKISIWKFWRWSDYLFKEKYWLPFLNWADVQKRRGHVELLHNQDF